MRILVTGSGGFVGKSTCEYLKAIGHDVIEFDLMNGRQDIRDFKSFEAFVAAMIPDRILHLAAIARFADADKDPRMAFEINAMGTMHVSRIASAMHIPIVYASTGSVYMPISQIPPITEEFPATGNSVYGVTKRVGEIYVAESGAPYIILRYAHLYGKEKRMHGLIGGFVERIQRGLTPTLYGGKQSNDFTYIKDIVRANYLALVATSDKWNQIYNIGTGEEITAQAAAELICKATGYVGKIEKKEVRTVDPERFVYDVSKAARMLGFKAEYSFAKGLYDMFELKKEEANASTQSS